MRLQLCLERVISCNCSAQLMLQICELLSNLQSVCFMRLLQGLQLQSMLVLFSLGTPSQLTGSCKFSR